MEIISQLKTKEKGLKRYFTGKPCKRGHLVERSVSNGNCLICFANWEYKEITVKLQELIPVKTYSTFEHTEPSFNVEHKVHAKIRGL